MSYQYKNTTIRSLIAFTILFFNIVDSHSILRSSRDSCPDYCVCNNKRTLVCNNVEELYTIPSNIDSNTLMVDLQNNNLNTIHDTAFDSCSSNLYTLKLNGNHITTINKRPLQYLLDLRILDLHNNDIQTIQTGAFDGLEKLNYLNLGYNKITHIQGLALKNLGKLTSLNIAHNYIDKYYTSPDTVGWSNRLTTLTISGNIIDCAIIPNSMTQPGARINYNACKCTNQYIPQRNRGNCTGWCQLSNLIDQPNKFIQCQKPTTISTQTSTTISTQTSTTISTQTSTKITTISTHTLSTITNTQTSSLYLSSTKDKSISNPRVKWIVWSVLLIIFIIMFIIAGITKHKSTRVANTPQKDSKINLSNNIENVYETVTNNPENIQK